jgi:hypothetical protein
MADRTTIKPHSFRHRCLFPSKLPPKMQKEKTFLHIPLFFFSCYGGYATTA